MKAHSNPRGGPLQVMRIVNGCRVCGVLALAVCGHIAAAQQVTAAASGRISSVAQNTGTGSIARTTGGERVGSSAFAVSEGKARTVSGKVQGYGARTVAGSTGESMFNGRSAGFAGSGYSAQGDFVATMPGPHLGGNSNTLSSSSGSSGFGISLSAPSGKRAASNSTHRRSASAVGGKPQIKDPDSILHPFTHSIGGGIGSMPGSLPTVLGSGASH